MANERADRADSEERSEEAPLTNPSLDEILDRFLTKLREVRGEDNLDVKCPVCGHDDWTLSEMGEVRLYEPGRISGSIYPVIPVVCDTCGYSMFFNAIALGVTGPNPTDSGEAEPVAEPSPESEP